MVTEETVEGAKEEHADSVGEGVSQEAVDAGAPRDQDVLCQFFVQVVGQEAGDDREPDDEEIDEVVEGGEHLVTRVEAEALRDLGEKQKAEILQVPVEQKRGQQHERAEASQQDRDAMIEEHIEAPAQEHKEEKSEDQVEGQELPTGWQEGLASTLSLQEGWTSIVELGVYCLVDAFPAGSQLLVDHSRCLFLEHVPLFILELLQTLEEVVHDPPVVPFVVLVEPEFVDVDEETQEGHHLSASWDLVEDCHSIIFDKTRKNGFKG